MEDSSTTPPSGSALDLVAVDGPGEGLHVQLDPLVALQIGRGLRGLEVPDPHVSLQHAVIEWKDTSYYVTDLDSAMGTAIDGAWIEANEPVAIGVGMTLTIGSTLFDVVERHARWRQAAKIGSVSALVFVVVVTLAFFLAPRSDANLALVWYEEISQGDHKDREFKLDRPFLRRRGLDPRQLRIRRVTDVDNDGVDEVWLQEGGQVEHVITFDATGRWVELGEIPVGCADVRHQGALRGGLPMLECGSVTWAIMDNGRYQVLLQDGVVIWGVQQEAWKGPGIPPTTLVQGYRGTMRRKTAFAGFLAANGIDQPIHYLLCENTFAGVRPVALLESGELQALSQGCGQAVTLGGIDLWDVRAIAFTAGGHQALMDDVEVFLSGGADGIFRDPANDELSAAWQAPVEGMGARWVTFDAQDHYFEPVAAEGSPIGVRELPHSLPKVPPLSTTAAIVGTGVVQLDPEGCTLFEVETEPWACPVAQGCLPTTPFLRLRSIGCGEQKTVEGTYATGTFDATINEYDVRVQIDGTELENKVEVHRARVAWRETAKF